MKSFTTRQSVNPYLLAMLALGLGSVGLFLLYQIPAINERLFWRVEVLRADIRELIAPRPEYLPPPQEAVDPNVVVTVASSVLQPAVRSDAAETEDQTTQPLPEQVFLEGTVHQWQHWNNCGPATLTMVLNYWGWPGTQANAAAALKPNRNDRNVSPHELVAYARQLGFGALTRAAGTPELLQRFIAAGIPVIIERDLFLEKEGWAGHYALIIGYDRAAGTYVTQDTFQGPELVITEARLNEVWFPFNYRFVVIFPAEREPEALQIMGPAADPVVAYQQAAQRAQAAVPSLFGERQAMAYFNMGLSLQGLDDSAGATAAFDQARILDIPFRMLWYQPEIYAAYYDQGRLSEVISLADFALDSNRYSEEAYYWRGRAYEALGDRAQAVRDYRSSVELNRNSSAPQEALAVLGESP